MTKDLNIAVLMDFYGQLLPNRQYAMMDMYYNSDLSLGEIAEQTEISRQGVRDSVKRGEKQLLDFEAKLGLAEKFSDITAQIAEMNSIIDGLENSDEVGRLKEISRTLSEKL